MKALLNQEHEAAMQTEALRAWQDVLKTTSRKVQRTVSDVVRDGAEPLADEFYQRMQQDERAATYLDQAQVQKRLRHSLRQWMVALFAAVEEDEIREGIDRQLAVGVVHARIRLPVDLISAGMRILKRGIRRRIEFAPLDDAERLIAVTYVSDLLHLADSLMTQAYIRDIKDVARNDEAYRLVQQNRSSAYEQARQRAALAEWVESLMLAVWEGSRPLPRLRESSFGIWLHHKGGIVFDDTPGFRELMLTVDLMDSALLPRLEAAGQERSQTESALASVKEMLSMIRLHLGEQFDLAHSRDDGLDSETQVPDRRYLPAILAREVRAHTTSQRPFCLMLIDLRLEGLQGDAMVSVRARVMQGAAQIITSVVRTTDHIFRYADSRFMVVAVETGGDRASTLAGTLVDRLRTGLSAGQVNGYITPIEPRIAIGIAEFDGHPDYQYFIQRTELALADSVAGRRPYRMGR